MEGINFFLVDSVVVVEGYLGYAWCPRSETLLCVECF